MLKSGWWASGKARFHDETNQMEHQSLDWSENAVLGRTYMGRLKRGGWFHSQPKTASETARVPQPHKIAPDLTEPGGVL